MEGLTITPDGSTLVGAMQAALQMPDLGSTKGSKVAVTRIITINLHTFQTKQYLYLLDNPATTGDANSEITALVELRSSSSTSETATSNRSPRRRSTRSTSTARPTSAT